MGTTNQNEHKKISLAISHIDNAETNLYHADALLNALSITNKNFIEKSTQNKLIKAIVLLQELQDDLLELQDRIVDEMRR